ncbi:MAG: methionine--tRNA ligase [Deltaproteobacteria bacterium]|nr:methionine--tRNA ligase [Deltaproteobacteria bacterium]
MPKFYLTTAIDYVNSIPHIGTAYEKIGADVLVRYRRLKGDEVRFQMGNDEHSANVQKAAIAQGLSPKVYCDGMREKFTQIWSKLRISYDDFIQTSEPRHHAASKKFFQVVFEKGDIYEGEYEGWYCESCEAYQTEKDLVEGLCPNHKTKPRWLVEKNYFFKLSKYREALIAHIEKNPKFILPDIRRNEILSLLQKEGLQDISISRSTFDWGIPVPANPKHVLYVWFDALLNYITAVGYGQDEAKFRQWWPAQLHIVGKDITRFHCVIWPAMLMSAGLELPQHVFGHGFVYLKGEKMSKSLGNVVTPLDIVEKFDADVLRYYLMRSSSFGSDGNFSWEDFITRYNSDLANDIGNLLSRTLGMAKKYFEGKIEAGQRAEEENWLLQTFENSKKKYHESLDYLNGDLEFHQALSAIWELMSACDKYIDVSAPWTLKKNNQDDRLKEVLFNLVNALRIIGLWISPFMPETSRKIYQQLNLPLPQVFQQNEDWSAFRGPHQLGESFQLFPRFENK